MHRYLRFVVLFLVGIFLWSCNSDYVYQEFVDISDAKWAYSDSISFAFDVPDTNSVYNLYIEIDHSEEFQYQNLYVHIHTTFPQCEMLTEQVSLQLSDKGFWVGNCRKGWCKARIMIQSDAYFDQKGIHQFVVEQFTRQNPVNGVQSIGFLIEDTNQSR